MKLTQQHRNALVTVIAILQEMESELQQQPGEVSDLAAAEVRGAIQDLDNVQILSRLTLKAS